MSDKPVFKLDHNDTCKQCLNRDGYRCTLGKGCNVSDTSNRVVLYTCRRYMYAKRCDSFNPCYVLLNATTPQPKFTTEGYGAIAIDAPSEVKA